jgi:Fe-S-cluster containining protein
MLDVLLQQYKILLRALDEKCAAACNDIPEIPCKKGCHDCCKQLFPLSMIEAFYINEGLQTLDRASRRKFERLAKKGQSTLADLNLSQFEISSDSLEDISDARNQLTKTLQSTKMDCPLITKDGTCTLYEHRNHDCRIHGQSYDTHTGEIVGCFRHPKIFSTTESKQSFTEKAVPSNFLYKEKSKLDSLATTELGQNPDLKYCYYFATPYTPLLINYREFDWPTFFKKHSQKKYSIVIHV